MALAGGPGLSVAEARAAVAARCWAGALAGPREAGPSGARIAGGMGQQAKIKEGWGGKGISFFFLEF